MYQRCPCVRDTAGFLQMSAVEALAGQGDGADIFGTGGTSGMPRAAIDALPVVRFAERGNVDAGGELIACSVCLQVSIIPSPTALATTRHESAD